MRVVVSQAVRVLVVGAGCVALLASASSTAKRTDVTYPTETLDEIAVTVRPAANVGWVIDVTNNRDGRIELDWDRSSYVSTTGESMGRLLRGETRELDSARSQPASPIASGATMREFCVPEMLVASLKTDQGAAAAGQGRGELHLAFRTRSGDEEWVGTVVWDGSAAPQAHKARRPEEPRPEQRGSAPRGFFCATSATVEPAGLCAREKRDCEHARGAAAAVAGDLTQCALVETAHCYQVDGVSWCAPTKAACDAQRANVAGSSACAETK